MKVRNMLLAAGKDQLKKFRWGDDVIGLIDTQTEGLDVTAKHSGAFVLNELKYSAYSDLLDAEFELEVANDNTYFNPEDGKFQIYYRGKTFAVTAGVIGAITTAIAIADVVRFQEIPTGKSLVDILRTVGNFL